MRKFWVIFFSILVACIVGVSMIFIFATRETIKITANVMYVNVGDEFELNLLQTNKDKSTTITATSSDSSIVAYDNGLCIAKTGGTARITFTTSNSRYRNLYCDVMVGDGSVENPYYISTAEQLASIGQPDSAYTTYSSYKLVANIDYSTINNGQWTPINDFSGTFDGNGYTISNLMIGNDQDNMSLDIENAGLFGNITADGAVYNLKIDNFLVFGSYTNVGTIAGVNFGKIERVEVKNTFIDVEAEIIGGLVGRNMTTDTTSDKYVATINESSANVVIGQSRKFNEDGEISYINEGVVGTIGGIAGYNAGGTIANSYSVGKVVLGATDIIYGGLVGDNQYNVCYLGDNSTIVPGKIENSYSAISLFSNKVTDYTRVFVGGVIGQQIDSEEEVNMDGVTLNENTNQLNGLYYDNNKLNTDTNTKTFTGFGKTILNSNPAEDYILTEKSGYVLGCTTNTMKVKTLYKNIQETKTYRKAGDEAILVSSKTNESSWDFINIWKLESNVNNGYPYLTYIYAEKEEEEVKSIEIVNTYSLIIEQYNKKSDKLEGLSYITVKDSEGEIVKIKSSTGKLVDKSNANTITIDIAEGFKISNNSKGIVVYDLNGRVFYSITFDSVSTNYKFDSIELDNNTENNNGVVNNNATVTLSFKSTLYNLVIIDSKTGSTKADVDISEGTSLNTYINNVANKYSTYRNVKFNTEINGAGSTYSSSSRMPSKDLTLYVLYSTTSNNSDDNITGDDKYNDDNNYDDNNVEDVYEISDEDDWNNYVVAYGDNDVKFVQTRSFTITSSFKACDMLAGSYDGNGYTIEVRGTLKNFALFNTIAKGAEVRELNVEYSNPTIRSINSSKYFGGIANVCKGSVINCEVDGNINLDNIAELGVAGIVGQLYEGEVIECNNSASVSAESQIVAGIVASMRKGTISECSNSGEITNEASSVNDYDYLQYGTVMSSGIVGYMYSTYTKTVSSNSNEGSVISQVAGANNGGNSGGIVAYAVNGSIYDNRNDGTIESEYQAGGIVAYSKSGTITSNVNYGSVIASTKTPNSNVAAGGIVGKVSDAGQVSNNIQQGSQVTASCSKSGYTESYAGGIIGCVFYGGTVKNNKLSSKCYISSTGTYAYAAGAVGRICEKTGSVSYSKTTFVSNWSSLSKTYVNANGGTTSWVDSDANYKD